MTTLTVGPGQQYATVGKAVAASHNGDTLNVQAGDYTNDFAHITTSITLQAVGGMVNMVATVPPPDGKGILTIGSTSQAPNVTITGFEFQGSEVSSNNGAGIRYQSGNLTLNGDLFQNNQMGLLATPFVNGTGNITINDSEFNQNGLAGGLQDGTNGLDHNLYVNHVKSLIMTNSLSEGAIDGHEVKSRALNTTLTNDLLYAGPTGTSVYAFDAPDGGNVKLTGNVFEQGPDTGNPALIAYGEETSKPENPGTSYTVSSNTILNDLQNGSIPMAFLTPVSTEPRGSGNQVWGLTANEISRTPTHLTGTTFLTSEPALNLTPPWEQIAATGTVDWFAPTTTALKATALVQPQPTSSGGAYPLHTSPVHALPVHLAAAALAVFLAWGSVAHAAPPPPPSAWSPHAFCQRAHDLAVKQHTQFKVDEQKWMENCAGSFKRGGDGKGDEAL